MRPMPQKNRHVGHKCKIEIRKIIQTNMKLTLKNRLLRYLERKGAWIASGNIQRLVAEKTSYTPQNVGRRLRELANEGKISRRLDSHGHAWYRIRQEEKPKDLDTWYKEDYMPEAMRIWNG